MHSLAAWYNILHAVPRLDFDSLLYRMQKIAVQSVHSASCLMLALCPRTIRIMLSQNQQSPAVAACICTRQPLLLSAYLGRKC